MVLTPYIAETGAGLQGYGPPARLGISIIWWAEAAVEVLVGAAPIFSVRADGHRLTLAPVG